jgi:2-dehydropantoate 2-reductase
MRILVLGAGGIGGYFGGRLVQAGADVTFLVRPRRAAQLAANGLVVKSPLGDFATPVKTISREQAEPGFDAVLLSCKAYDLDDAIASIRPVTGALVVPLLNGMLHLDALDAAFGADNVAGGVAQIGITLDADGTIRHLSRIDVFNQGPRNPAQAARSAALAAVAATGSFEARHSETIVQDMWEKFVFLCAMAATCCLLRGNIKEVAATQDGKSVALEIFEDCIAGATGAGFPPRTKFVDGSRVALTENPSVGEPSMLRDLRGGGPVEAAHIVGDMLARARAAGRAAPLLRAAYAHLQVYEGQRAV